MEQIVFHVDVNSAFLSWEAVHRLRHLGEARDLRDQICAVGGNGKLRRGIILAKSMRAGAYGVKTGESIVEARRKCPELELVPANYELYQESSGALMALLNEYSSCVEQYSIDEAFMDMSGMEAILGKPKEAAETIRKRIRRELGFTVNIGISSNKLLAKMASDFEKPDLVHTLFPAEIEAKMWPLPVRELFSVGSATAKKLNAMGIRTIGDLAQSDPRLLFSHLKKQGEAIWNFANGRDFNMVEAEAPEHKCVGNSTTIAFDVTDSETARMVLLSLAETVGGRLRRQQMKAENIAITIKNSQFQSRSHQMALKEASDITEEIYLTACRLFDELWDGSPIRLLGIQTSHLKEESARQMSIFDKGHNEKLEKLDKAVDEIRSKFGIDAVKRASFLETPLEHMAGRISEKKADYRQTEIE